MSGAALEYEARSVTARTAGIFASAQPAAENLRSVAEDIDLNGHANALWEQKGGLRTWGVPSHDGRHLAMLGYTMDSNIWMLENF